MPHGSGLANAFTNLKQKSITTKAAACIMNWQAEEG